MGTVISSKLKDDNKVVLEIILDYDEALQLHGHMERVYVFSEKNSKLKTGISQRGKNDATKYFLIPRELRNNLKFDSEVRCQRIDTKTKSVFIYVVNNYDFKNKKNTNRN